MLLAHTAEASGPHTEYLVLAGAFLVLGIVLFVQKTVKPVVSLIIVLLAVALASGAFILGGSPQTPDGIRVVVLEPKPGDPVPAGEEFPIEVGLNGAQMATSPNAGDGGHIHVYVDDELIDMPTTLKPTVKLKEGEHTITIEFVDSKHVPYSPEVKDTIEVVAKS